MNLLIFEPNLSGHRANYLRMSIEAFVKEGYKLTVLSVENMWQHPVFTGLDNHIKKEVTTANVKMSKVVARLYQGDKLFNKELINIWLIRRFVQQQRKYSPIDLIFLPYLDHISRALALFTNPFFGVKVMGIMMTPSFHYFKLKIADTQPRLAFLQELLFRRLLSRQHVFEVLTIDSALVKYAERQHYRYRQKLSYLPDPVQLSGSTSQAQARSIFNIPQAMKVILVYGALTERKGVLELIDALEDKAFPDDVCILLAGSQTEKLRSKLGTFEVNDRVLVFDRFLTKEEEFAAFQCADIVWCGYKGFFGMSAVLVQAGAMGVPVIAGNQGMINWVVQNYRTGISVNVFEKEQIINGVKTLLGDKEMYCQFSENGKKMAAAHSVEAFQATLFRKATECVI